MLAGLIISMAVFAAPAPAPGGGAPTPATMPEITPGNWRAHPAISAIRDLVARNEAAIASGVWTRETTAVCEPPATETRRTLFRNPEGRIRKFVTEGGSDDSAYRLEHHYDEGGRLRFAFGRSGAANQTVVEHRRYFDEGGNLLWKDRRQQGPGYTFPDDWPDGFLVREPDRRWTAPKPCR